MNSTATPLLSAAPASVLVSPLSAPADLLALHRSNPPRYPHLLQSVARGTPQARFDILFAFPGESVEGTDVVGFLHRFDAAWRAERMPDTGAGAQALPFTGGWFVFLGYELVAEIEQRLAGIPRSSALPVARATRFPAAVINDHATGRGYIVCEAEAGRRSSDILADLAKLPPAHVTNGSLAITALEEGKPDEFLAGVARVKEYIAAGDVFQVNLSRPWRAALDQAVAPADLYARLCAANPAPFAALVTLDEHKAVISSSPERLVEVRGKRVRTRPIAGTHPRSQDPNEDTMLAQMLIRHPKERAEHVMLIDLERNDLGRLCRAGSVQVTELMVLESYRHVHHIVSEVVGFLRDDIVPADVIRAVFPGGTITGCPKIRCMEIIRELEGEPRGAYTGSVGYINRDGSMDLNILIRSMTLHGSETYFRAGSGIVADSVPERELAETRAKVRGLVEALRSHAP